MKIYEQLCQKYDKGLTKKQRAELLCFCKKISILSNEPKFYLKLSGHMPELEPERIGTFISSKSVYSITHKPSGELEQIHFAICFDEYNDSETDNNDYVLMTFYQNKANNDDMFMAKTMCLPLFEAFQYIQSVEKADGSEDFSFCWS